MTKWTVVGLATVVAGLCLAAVAQNSEVRSSSAKSGSDRLQTSTKPLTPKSAMPAQRKSSISMPNSAANAPKTNAELAHLERQSNQTGAPKTSSSAPGKGASQLKPVGNPAPKSSGIDFKYQKPVGGTQAATPSSHTANSGAHVKKN